MLPTFLPISNLALPALECLCPVPTMGSPKCCTGRDALNDALIGLQGILGIVQDVADLIPIPGINEGAQIIIQIIHKIQVGPSLKAPLQLHAAP